METIALHAGTLDIGEEAIRHGLALIDAQERHHAARFRFDRDRRRFIARRARLRVLLAAHIGERPERLAFGIGLHGKPVLPGGAVQFSLSHSHGAIMVAIATVAVGCDMEWRDPALDWPPLAGRFFTPAEAGALAAMPPTAARRGFFDVWTRKEACVKALGLGLSCPLDAFEVSVQRKAWQRGLAGWTLADAAPLEGWSGAVAAHADAVRIERRTPPA